MLPNPKDQSTMPDDGLHAFVCPHCGNNVFDGGHIKCYEDEENMHWFRCWGGFGITEYRWIPHKCSACNTTFLAWTSKKRINGNVIGYYLILIMSVVFFIASIGLAVAIEPAVFALEIIFIPTFIASLFGIDQYTEEYKDIGPDSVMNYLKRYPPDFMDDDEDEQETNYDNALQSLASACMATPNQMREVCRVLAGGELNDPEPCDLSMEFDE